jgi:septal ring factor EnvC (AmiA/AmiB activator)
VSLLRFVFTASLAAAASAGCATKDCSGYDPATDNDLFKASGGLASKCYQRNVEQRRQQVIEERAAGQDLAARSAQLEQQLQESQAKNDELQQRVGVARENVRQLEGEISALKTDADPTVRKAVIEKRLKQIEQEIEALRKADAKAERDKAEFLARRKDLETEFERLQRVYRAFAK